MSEERRKVATLYGEKLRVRICGLLRRSDGALLCGLHKGVGELGALWVPPGGGLEFGESVAECLKREFLEETELDITPGQLFTWNEFVAPPLHAIELFFQVESTGSLDFTLGHDPEWPLDEAPVLAELRWISADDLTDERLFHKVVVQVLKG